jgi:hypothetical protein
MKVARETSMTSNACDQAQRSCCEDKGGDITRPIVFTSLQADRSVRIHITRFRSRGLWRQNNIDLANCRLPHETGVTFEFLDSQQL